MMDKVSVHAKRGFLLKLLLLHIGCLCAIGITAKTHVNNVPTFTASASDNIKVDTPFQLMFTVTSTKELDDADLMGLSVSTPKGLTELMGPTRAKVSQSQNIGGKIISSHQVTYTYILSASQAGTFTIPAASIIVKGEKLCSQPLALTVVPAKQSSSGCTPQPRLDAFITATPGLYKVNVSSTLNVRNAPDGEKIGSLSDGELVQVTAWDNGWAQISLGNGRTGYVSEQYLEPLAQLVSSGETSHSTLGLSGLRHYAPFAILLFAVLALIGMRTENQPLFHMGCFLWGVTELFMFGAGSDSALVWFCTPSDVGWVMTIINFFIAIGVLYFQYIIYREFTDNLFDGFWRKLLFGIFIVTGVVLFLGMFQSWHYILAFVAYMAVLLYLLRDCGIWMSLSFTVFAFGLGISFLGMLSTLILGALLWLGLAAFAGSGGSKGNSGNIIIEDYDGTYEAYEHGFGIYKDVTGSGKTWRKEGSRYIRIN